MLSRPDQETLKRNSTQWLDYFNNNNANLMDIQWDKSDHLSEEEREAITSSIQIFQLGERSEGKHLAKCAKQHAQDTEDYNYFEAVKLFIKEEQRHARDLGRFMKIHSIDIIQKTPTDSIFRWLRHLANLELSISILVAAEIVAQIYYPALQKATHSSILQQLCHQIIEDEEDHVTFQSQRLAILRKDYPLWMINAIRFTYKLFFLATIIVVWFGHKKVFLRSGLTFSAYLNNSFNRLKTAIHKMDPINLGVNHDQTMPQPVHTADCQN